MKPQDQRTKQAEAALELLKEGVHQESKTMVLSAINSIDEDKEFTWDDLDLLFSEWDEVIDEALDILQA